MYKNIVGSEIPARPAKILSEAEKIRDRVLHGKRVAEREQRTAIVYLVEYAETTNEELQNKASFSPFKADQRGYAGRRVTLPDATSAWVTKGLGFGTQDRQ